MSELMASHLLSICQSKRPHLLFLYLITEKDRDLISTRWDIIDNSLHFTSLSASAFLQYDYSFISLFNRDQTVTDVMYAGRVAEAHLQPRN